MGSSSSNNTTTISDSSTNVSTGLSGGKIAAAVIFTILGFVGLVIGGVYLFIKFFKKNKESSTKDTKT